MQFSHPPLVLMHGWGMNSRVWSPVLPLLQAGFEVRALDLPGHGIHAQQSAAETLEDWADKLLAQAREPAIWMGWSLGGLAALVAAQKAPQNVRALILVAATPKFAIGPDWPYAIEPSLLYKFEAELRDDYRQLLEHFIVLQAMGSAKVREEARGLRRYVQEGGEPSAQALALGLRFLLREDRRTELRELECPCLLILGDRDKLVPVELADVFRREYPHVHIEIIKGSGHAPFLSHADEFADIAANWIKNL